MSVPRGQVRCGTLPGRFGPGIQHSDGSISKKHPVIPGFTNINVTSASARYKYLSPMKLGPFNIVEKRVPLTYYPEGVHPGFVAVNENQQQASITNAENWWQGSKMFQQDVVNGVIQASFFIRRAKMFKDPKPHRRALPKATAGLPIASYFDGNVLAYVPSRKNYIDYYGYLVQMRPEFQELMSRLDNGENLHIIGFDGYDPASGLPYGANPITYTALENAMYYPGRPFGHELVLCGLLSGIRPWENFDPTKVTHELGVQ